MKTIRPALPAFFVLILSVVLSAATSGSQEPAKPPDKTEAARFNVLKASTPITIDGVLDEAAWNEAPAIPLPFEWTPGDNVPLKNPKDGPEGWAQI